MRQQTYPWIQRLESLEEWCPVVAVSPAPGSCWTAGGKLYLKEYSWQILERMFKYEVPKTLTLGGQVETMASVGRFHLDPFQYRSHQSSVQSYILK